MQWQDEILNPTELQDHLSKLQLLFSELTQLVADEHQAIGESHLPKIEAITSKKIELSENIQKLSNQFAIDFDGLLTSIRSQCAISEEERMSVVDLAEYCEGHLGDSYEDKLLKHEMKKVSDLFQELRDLKKKSNPLIEMNQYLVKKLLRHHQETFRFWQGVAAESASIYGEKGTAKQTGSHATIIVRT